MCQILKKLKKKEKKLEKPARLAKVGSGLGCQVLVYFMARAGSDSLVLHVSCIAFPCQADSYDGLT